MIHGGWEYVWGAYGVSWVLLGSYALSLLLRQRKLRHEEKSR
ncbi:MAG: heme exporter protein CcmD [Deltaproteobacteria bacterium]|nr:heme exporter protein CcmD [Deltaproteobacteria bacterium]